MDSNTYKLVHTFESLADLGQEIAGTGNFNEMVRTSLHLLLGTLALRRGAVIECLSNKNTVNCISRWGLGEDYSPEWNLTADDHDAFLSAGVLRLSEPEPSFSDFIDRYGQPLQQQSIELVVAMVVHGQLTGLVLLGNKATREPFTDSDLEIIRAMARHIGVGIHGHRLLEQIEQRAEENRRLYVELRAIYSDTVKAFAAAIDIKDKYTQGHSERVGKYSEAIAREMGWREEEVEGIKIAGYLHDVGKLVVERDIINAPYRIDAKASNELNRHPAAGFEILKPINHPYADIPLMAKYHHERLDGRGYPDGLFDKQIPMGAKIVCLADCFDAMTTDRPYRKRRSLEEVIEDFRRNTGTQFDPIVVVAFCRALLKEIQGETKDRRIMKILGKGYLEGAGAAQLIKQLIAEIAPGEEAKQLAADLRG
jgi:HD domain-containing protein/GAF domain-containing protein